MRIPPILIARHLCKLLPSQLRTRVLSDHAFVSQYGRMTSTIITVGGIFPVDQSELFEAARRLLAGKGSQALEDVSGREISVILDGDIVRLKAVDQQGRDLSVALPDLVVLSPSRDHRTRAIKRMIDSFGPATRDFSTLQLTAERRELTDDEFADLLEERINGFAAHKSRIAASHQADQIHVADIVPGDLLYFEQLGGAGSRPILPEQYLTEVLPAYRRRLLQCDLVQGLEICLLGSLRDDLMPAIWTSSISDDAMWNALEAIDTRANPFAALGVLDIAIARQHDGRYKALASEMIIELGKEQLLRPDGVDCYDIMPLFAQLTADHLNVLEGCALRDPLWKRLCAWMHAGLLVQSTLNIQIELDAFREWINRNRDMAGIYAQMVDLRHAPMYRAGEFSRTFLREEIIGRLVALRARYQAGGIAVPHSEVIDSAVDRLTSGGSPLGWAMPGPLDGHIRPTELSNRSLSEVDTAYVLQQLSESPSGPIWSKLAYFSQYFDLGEKILGQACRACATANFDYELSEWETHPTRFFSIGFIAAAQRSKNLANSIAAIAAKRASSATSGIAAISILRVILLASAAFEKEDEWSWWTRDQLVRLAHNLPAGEATSTLRENLVEIKRILPIGLATVSGAEAVAAAAD